MAADSPSIIAYFIAVYVAYHARAAFNRLRLRPRVLRNVGTVDASATILGTHLASPICIAPTGMFSPSYEYLVTVKALIRLELLKVRSADFPFTLLFVVVVSSSCHNAIVQKSIVHRATTFCLCVGYR